MPENGFCDFKHVARQLLDDGARRRGMMRQPLGDCRPRGNVRLLQQTVREFGVLSDFLRRGIWVLHVAVGDDSQQRRPDVDAIVVGKIQQAVEIRIGPGVHR